MNAIDNLRSAAERDKAVEEEAALVLASDIANLPQATASNRCASRGRTPCGKQQKPFAPSQLH